MLKEKKKKKNHQKFLQAGKQDSCVRENETCPVHHT